MARELSEKDWTLLKILAPECDAVVCISSGFVYRSILPPVANHYANDEQDFLERLSRLSDEDLQYLVSLVTDGSESLGCVEPAYAEAFVELVRRRLGSEAAESVLGVYEEADECVT
jgi:hypothetical protein